MCEEEKTRDCYLVDFLLRVCEEGGEVAEGVTVEHHLRLFICASHYVPHGPQGSSLDVEGECILFIEHVYSDIQRCLF